MSLDQEQRVDVEEAIFDAHFSAQKYLETGKDLHEKLLEVSVADAVELLATLTEAIADDPKAESYKMHLFVPLHLHNLLQLRKEQSGNVEEE